MGSYLKSTRKIFVSSYGLIYVGTVKMAKAIYIISADGKLAYDIAKLYTV